MRMQRSSCLIPLITQLIDVILSIYALPYSLAHANQLEQAPLGLLLIYFSKVKFNKFLKQIEQFFAFIWI